MLNESAVLVLTVCVRAVSTAHIDMVNKRRELYGHIYSEIGEALSAVSRSVCIFCGVL
jgi:hypothetical protein